MPAQDQTLNDVLNRYTDTKVKLRREETREAIHRVLDILEPILKYVNEQDSRFSHEIQRAGSYACGLKVSKPDEFDFLVSVKSLPNFVWVNDSRQRFYIFNTTGQICRTTVPLPSPPNGYHFVSFKNDRHDVKQIWREDTKMKVDDDLIPFQVKSYLKGLVTQAIRVCDLRGEVIVNNRTNGPAITLRLRTGKSVSIDLVAQVPANGRGLPPVTLRQWPRSHVWPPRNKVEEVKATGTDSVPKDNLYWQTSFGRCEKVLIDGIDADEGCRKQCLRILKKLREDHWSMNGQGKPALSSYHLKTLLLWECEKYPQSSDWSRDKLGERVMGLVRQLKRWSEEKRCPHYFIESINLFADKYGKLKNEEGLDLVAEKLGEFIDDPQCFLCE